mmetsp:Transcript_8879/g.22890  ORF Transcript_8879/g.22890 Transcript_8879/m.22890 type:complete len:267 (+) Transcript_8879:76-876(+)
MGGSVGLRLRHALAEPGPAAPGPARLDGLGALLRAPLDVAGGAEVAELAVRAAGAAALEDEGTGLARAEEVLCRAPRGWHSGGALGSPACEADHQRGRGARRLVAPTPAALVGLGRRLLLGRRGRLGKGARGGVHGAAGAAGGAALGLVRRHRQCLLGTLHVGVGQQQPLLRSGHARRRRRCGSNRRPGVGRCRRGYHRLLDGCWRLPAARVAHGCGPADATETQPRRGGARKHLAGAVALPAALCSEVRHGVDDGWPPWLPPGSR